MSTARFLQPAWIYGILGAFFGLSLVFITPPFQVPDEPNHFYRACQVSQGGFLGQFEQARSYPGGFLPESLERSVVQLTRGVQQNTERRYSISWIQEAFEIELEPGREKFLAFPNTVIFSPVSYLPQAAGIAAGRALDLPPLALLYLGRLAALAFTVLLGCWTLHVIRFFRWPLLLLLLMPMTVFQAASVSADAVTNALSIAFCGSILSEMSGCAGPISRARKAQWAGLFALVTLSKTVYVILGLLIFMIPPERFGGRRRQLGFLSAFFMLGGAAFVGWSWFANSVYVPFHPYVHTNLREQLSLVLTNPAGFVEMVFWAFVRQREAYRHMFIGVLGWLDTYLPVWLLNAYTILLLLAAGFDGDPDLRMGFARRIWLGFTAAAGLLAVSLSTYCLWTAVGSAEIDSIQGRYFIPLAPVVLLLFYNSTFAGGVKPLHKAAVVIPSLVLTWLVTVSALVDRYYSL